MWGISGRSVEGRRTRRGFLWPPRACRPVLWVAPAAALWMVVPVGRAPAADPGRPQAVVRSLRDDLARRLDELDLPRYHERACHRGWETRTRHFVVVATTSQEQATWTALEMERAWSDFERMADQWTDVHRRPTFGIGAVNVLVVDAPGRPWDQPAAGPRNTNYTGNVYINLSEGRGTLDHRLPQLREEAIRAFLRVAQLDQTLPDWVQLGLAAYFSGAELTREPRDQFDPPGFRGAEAADVQPYRLTRDRMAPTSADRLQAALWVRFFLLGNDAQHAHDFFDALSGTVSGQPQDRFVPYPGGYRGRSTGSATEHAAEPPLQALLSRQPIRATAQAWLDNPDMGQPILRPEPSDMAVDESHRRLVLILKLGRRFAAAGHGGVQPKVYERGRDVPAAYLTKPAYQPAATPPELYGRLSQTPRWATVDTDGSLLTSGDQARLAEVFGVGDPDVRYRTFLRDGHTILEAAYPRTGHRIEAWLEENPDDPTRPIARLREPTIRPPGPKTYRLPPEEAPVDEST